ncbi:MULTISPECIES: hypothetical protein [Erwinia]|uniref:hypothetical protein n=1 Tax=Erwinia TaxID=551 RepID=UPI00133117E6|nr:hypothetical protein [Erwinia rhapontici]MBP2156295.1 hypothetical protein [Erwinia rhapontici]NKG30026.1 hypothetical protein [Erwinia rhapontici]
MTRIVTQLQNKFIMHAIKNLSHENLIKNSSYFICDAQYFLLALTKKNNHLSMKNIVLIFNNELEVFIFQSICNVPFFALDVRSQDVFTFFKKNKLFKKIKPLKKNNDSIRMRVFLLILRHFDDEAICQSLFISMKRLKEIKSQLTWIFFEKRRNLFYLTLNVLINHHRLAA